MSDTPQTQYTPAEAAFAARVSAETGEEAVFVFAYNLSFDNEFIDGFAAVAGGALYAADSPGGALKKTVLPAGAEVRYVQNVGCAAIEYEADGVPAELLRTDMCIRVRSRTRCAAARAGRGTNRFRRCEPDRTRCPKCGTPYRHNSTVCPHCIDRKKLLRRLWLFAKPSMKPLLGRGASVFCSQCARRGDADPQPYSHR